MTEQLERSERPRARCRGIDITPRAIEGRPDCLVLHLDGYIDAYNAAYFRQEVEQALDSGVVGLLLDLARVTYVSSLGVGAMVQIHRRLRSAHRELIVAGTAKRVHQIFELLGMTSFFIFVPSVEAGLRLLVPSHHASVFPKLDRCPACTAALRFSSEGRVRCPHCKSLMAVDAAGVVTLA